MTERALRDYHAASWDEPVIFELGSPGRRGAVFPAADEADADPEELVPEGLRRKRDPELPELSEHEVQRHFLHLSQETLGMMGINLFGTCTMKYNPRLSEDVTAAPDVASLHPYQPVESLQGVLEIIDRLNRILCELSGMDQFTFQPGGGADAAYTHACVTRAYHAARGELAQRSEIITSIQAHPCNPATAAAAGFDVVTLPIEEDGYPSLTALEAAVSDKTAALMIGNPDDMGIYNPEIKRWVETVHEAGGLCFYDHANFNGVMTRLRARELGFDACMYMLHKTFGAPKGGGGPAVGAYGCSEELVPYLPRPFVTHEGGSYGLDTDPAGEPGKVREFFGNVPQIIKAYSWVMGMGAAGLREAADISVLANNYMETRLMQIPGVTKSQAHLQQPRLEMTRYSLDQVAEETGVTVMDFSHRMVDYAVDAFWLSHEPWLVPEPFTPEAGETWSKEDIDYWIDVIAQVRDEAYADPDLVKSAPHNHPLPRLDASELGDPSKWATTWRAHLKKHVEA